MANLPKVPNSMVEAPFLPHYNLLFREMLLCVSMERWISSPYQEVRGLR